MEPTGHRSLKKKKEEQFRMILLLGLGDGVNGCPIYRDKE